MLNLNWNRDTDSQFWNCITFVLGLNKYTQGWVVGVRFLTVGKLEISQEEEERRLEWTNVHWIRVRDMSMNAYVA